MTESCTTLFRRSGVRTTLEVWPGMFHVWHLLAGTLPEADQAVNNAIHFLEQALTKEQESANLYP
ncbi:hypothetical protein BFG07_10660 [Kosakonia cowanii]|nr:hypothetical protein BFG07_10660 [Kosakonia cowanii]